MLKRTNRPSKMRSLAAPIVVTAVLAPGCSGPIHENPGRPEMEPTASPTESAGPADTGAVPTGSASSAPVAVDLESLPDPPAGWKIEKNADGSCTAIPEPMECPPSASCNPAPPFRVKCVASGHGAKKPEKK